MRLAGMLLGDTAQMVGLDELHRQGPAWHGWPIALAVFDEFALSHPGQCDRFSPWL
jgi:hypothetical protein